jgi:hypothetical protein
VVGSDDLARWVGSDYSDRWADLGYLARWVGLGYSDRWADLDYLARWVGSDRPHCLGRLDRAAAVVHLACRDSGVRAHSGY